ncbi:hypothetical protein SLEP1_g1673 [Rubroshorea leprosula]|uniref:Uncharacterized protein n=1 Tax=Rubroshorea leprosula TaxID=152421 RepID=A0AAV5HPY3_9ROSI|nr:hypothetical protein SLEP1_g1673 [Rubroshorea leprosula]
MGRKKTRAKQHVGIRSNNDEEEDKVVIEEVVILPSLMKNYKDQESGNLVEVFGTDMEEMSDLQIESFEENFEEVDTIVSVVMEMDVKVKQDVIKNDGNNENAKVNMNFSNENVNLGSQCTLEESVNFNNKDAIEVKTSNLNGGLFVKEKNMDVSTIDKLNMGSSSVGFEGKELDDVMDDTTAVVVGISQNAIDDSKLLTRVGIVLYFDLEFVLK